MFSDQFKGKQINKSTKISFDDSQFPPFNANLKENIRSLPQREKAATVDLLVGSFSPVALQLFFIPLESP